MVKKFDNVTELEIVEKYKNGYTTRVLCSEYGFKLNNRHGILKILKRHNIPIRKDNFTHAKRYTVNEFYFDNIDTEDKAYFLGLLYADGNICSNTLRLTLQKDDEYILDKYKECIGYNGPTRYKFPDNPKHKIACNVDINCKNLCNKLIDMGIVPNKNKNVTKIFKVEDGLMHHFVRGLFDGDGSVFYRDKVKKHIIRFSFTGNVNIINFLQDVLEKYCGIEKNKVYRRYKDREDSSVQFSHCNTYEPEIFYKWLYKDATIYMERKFNIFKGIFG